MKRALLLLALAACRPGHGPHITLNTPPSPNFGDSAPDSHTYGGRGAVGGGAGRAETPQTASGGGSSPAKSVGVALGAIAGSAALAAVVATGGIVCKPGEDSHSSDGGAAMNVCSGEHKEAATDVQRAFRPGGAPNP
jgi:hypothetical protein